MSEYENLVAEEKRLTPRELRAAQDLERQQQMIRQQVKLIPETCHRYATSDGCMDFNPGPPKNPRDYAQQISQAAECFPWNGDPKDAPQRIMRIDNLPEIPALYPSWQALVNALFDPARGVVKRYLGKPVEVVLADKEYRSFPGENEPQQVVPAGGYVIKLQTLTGEDAYIITDQEMLDKNYRDADQSATEVNSMIHYGPYTKKLEEENDKQREVIRLLATELETARPQAAALRMLNIANLQCIDALAKDR